MKDKAQPVRLSYSIDHLCGGIAGGAASCLLVHPLDLLKVQFAVNEGHSYDGAYKNRPRYNSYVDAIRKIVRTSGVRSLYQGLAPNLSGHIIAWGLYMQFYNILKDRYTCSEGVVNAKNLACGVVAGAFTLTLTNPLWTCKTQQMLQYDRSGTRTMYMTLRDLYKLEGIKGWYRGYSAGLIGTSHGAIQIVLYDALKRRYNSYSNRSLDDNSKMPTAVYLSCSAISKMIAVVVTYPYQLIRSRLQDQHTTYSGIGDVIKRTWRHEGIYGFYKGMIASIVRVTPAIMCTFVVYEHVSHGVRDLLA